MKLVINIIVVLFIFKVTGFIYAQPESLDTFYDFEDAGGFGTFIIGESPNSIEVVNFSVETVSDANLAHSGSEALVLIPGSEGIIIFERGVNLLQFYAVETTRQGGMQLLKSSRLSEE